MFVYFFPFELNPPGLPTLAIEHLNPMWSVDCFASKYLRVPGDIQYALSFHEPPLYTLASSFIKEDVGL